MMLQFNPTSRPTMVDVLGHPWMRGKKASQKSFEKKAKAFINAAAEEQKIQISKLGVDNYVKPTRRNDNGFN